MRDNSESCADPSDESKHRKPTSGVFVPGNMVTSAPDLLKAESQGSWGYGLDQGEHRVSHRQPNEVKLVIGQDLARIKADAQGSHAHLGGPYQHDEAEDRL